MSIKRIISRTFFHLQKFLIGCLAYFNSRVYMKFYNPLLKKAGIRLNGTPRFISKSASFDNFNYVTLGDRLTVSSNVSFLTHDYSLTTALISINEKPKTDTAILKEIVVGNNVFIGMNCILLPGTKIGNNVIIGAGSVVRGEIPDNSIVMGNPAAVVTDIRDYAEKMKKKDVELYVDKK